MKLIKLLSVLLFAQISFAQMGSSTGSSQSSSLSGTNLAILKGFNLFIARTSEQTDLLALKFGQIGSAKIQYSRYMVRLITQKVSDDCSTGALCTNAVATQTVELPVLLIERQECADIYYAQTPANVKSKFYEEIRIVDNNVGRCAYIQEQYNEVIYRITGSNSNLSSNNVHSEWIQFLSRPLVTNL